MTNYVLASKRAKELVLFKKEIVKRGIKKFYVMCCVCGWDATVIDLCHVYSFRDGGRCSVDNIAPLCPNHHRIFDRGLANDIHKAAIYDFLSLIAHQLEAS